MTELPEGWTTATIGDLATTIRGVTYKKSDSSNLPGEGLVPLLRATNFDDGVETGGDLVYIPATLVKPEQVLMESDLLVAMSSGSIAVVGKSVPIGQPSHQRTFGAFCGVVRPNPATNARFLHHYSASPNIRQSWSDSARGTNINNLKPRTVESTAVPVPPIEEQDEIVRILDTQLARLDTVMGAVQAVRDKAEQFRRSLLHAAFTGQLTQPDPLRGTDLPATWGTSDLGDIAAMSLGKMLDRKAATGKHLRPYLRNINVRWGEFDLGDVAEMDIGPSEVERVTVKPGDVVVCEGGEPGRAAVWVGPPIAIQKALHRVRLNENILPEFIQRHLENEFRGRTTHPLFTGTTIKHLPKDKFKTMAVPVPSRTEQQEIVNLTEAQLARLDRVLEVADHVEAECGRLRRSLLQSAFTGELTRKWREANG